MNAIRTLDPPHGEAPVIAVSAGAFATDVAACLEAGMNDFLPKPLRRGDVEKLLKQHGRGVSTIQAALPT